MPLGNLISDLQAHHRPWVFQLNSVCELKCVLQNSHANRYNPRVVNARWRTHISEGTAQEGIDVAAKPLLLAIANTSCVSIAEHGVGTHHMSTRITLLGEPKARDMDDATICSPPHR